ncbi:methyltransferase domain-containing protein [Yinghuangia soli]|uniref:Protein-L-isoaspartate O-methyltransferase n=1 Tax=Yinghuangia soli TaxID=2908204 RepID=A0AA41U2Q1_9ACTN|nr:methyltransferase domain-containing protein [Yinghuangia soli]MCF2528887.1 methyltransferase domain-containing protein [Yinghuangia soli]
MTGELDLVREMLGRDRTPFLPDVVWRSTAVGYVRLDRQVEPAAWQDAADADCVLVTQWDDGETEDTEGLPTCSASLPSLVEQMLDATDIREGHSVLEIGTGTGYTAALLKDRVGDGGCVVSVEVDAGLAELARGRLRDAGVDVDVVRGDGLLGWGAGAPYDRVHVTCGIRRIPAAWLRQCPDGVIMLPWGTSLSGERDRILALRTKNGVGVGRFGDEVGFMKARSQRIGEWGDWPDGDDTVEVELPLRAEEIEASVEAYGGFVVGLQLPRTTCRLTGGGEGERVLWLRRDGVHASIGFGEGHRTSVEGDAGLIRDYVGAARWWLDRGRPEPGRFGLAVGEGEQRVWFDAPDGESWKVSW